MIDDTFLDKAVQRGIIDIDQRTQLIDLACEPETAIPPIEDGADEDLRLVGGGNDLFVTVGIVLLFLGALFGINTFVAGNQIIGAAIIGIAAWVVAEFVTRQHRMKLSSTVLGLIFITCVGAILRAQSSNVLDVAALEQNPALILGMRSQIGTQVSLVFGGLILAAIIYFWRFRIPIMAAVIALSFAALVFLWSALLIYDGVSNGNIALPTMQQVPLVLERALYVPLICGFIVFGVALMFDIKDRERFTVWSDCAFWLHVISAPLLVHPLFILATGQDVVLGRIEPGSTATVLLALLIIGFVYVALAIDRRSLLIPTLAYFGSLGVYYMIENTANTTGVPPFAIILLVIGMLVIMFGAGWQRIRALIVRPTLPTSVLNKLPPIKV